MLPDGYSMNTLLGTADVQRLLQCSKMTAWKMMKEWGKQGHAHKVGGTTWKIRVGDLVMMEPILASQLMEWED